MKTPSFVLTALLIACAPVTPAPSTSAPIFFTAERVAAGRIRLALDNGSSAPIGYNLCTSELQRRSGTEWTAVPTDEVCTMELRTLDPGHDATFEKRLPSGLAAGDYRYMTRIESPVGGTMVSVATEPFQLP